MNRNKRYYNDGYEENSKLILEKLDKIDNDINSNPFTKLFKVKGKLFKYSLCTLLFTAIVMILLYILFIYLCYGGLFTWRNTFEILGNGFYWILGGLIYFSINQLFFKKGLLK